MKWFLVLLFMPMMAFAQKGRLADSNFATLSELITRGASASALLNDTKIYVGTNGINKQLSQAIADGDIGGGGSGAAGLNLVENTGFERNLDGYIASGTMATRELYANGTEFNKYFVQITSTASGGYYETEPLIVPNILANGDLQTQAFVYPVSGTWSIQSLSGTTVVASQTLNIGTDFVKSPIIFNPAGPASGSMKVRFQSVVSGSVLRVDNVYKGEPVNLKNGAVVGPFEDYTVNTAQGLGTLTNSKFQFRRIGSTIQILASFTTGIIANTQVQIPLPPGLIIDPARVSAIIPQKVGTATHTATANQYIMLASGNLNYLTVGIQNGTLQGTVPANGTGNFNGNQSFSFDAIVPILGFTGSSTTFDSTCPNDISCTNEFSAIILSAGTVLSSNLNSISCVSGGAGVYNCTFSQPLTAVPACVATPGNPALFTAVFPSVTTTGFTLNTRNAAGALANTDSAVTCTRQADFKAKRTIEGFLSKQVTSTGNFIERMERVKFGGAGGAATNCNVSPCTIQTQSGAITNVTRNATGAYTVNFLAGTFSGSPVCTCISYAHGVSQNMTCTSVASTPTSFVISTLIGNNGALQDTEVNVLCMGPR